MCNLLDKWHTLHTSNNSNNIIYIKYITKNHSGAVSLVYNSFYSGLLQSVFVPTTKSSQVQTRSAKICRVFLSSDVEHRYIIFTINYFSRYKTVVVILYVYRIKFMSPSYNMYRVCFIY